MLYVAREHRDRVTDKRVDGPADLVVEPISDDSGTRDRGEKFREYETAGVPEYWLIDPRPGQRWAAFHQVGQDGRYRPVPVDHGGRYRSATVPGFWLRPDWLWQDPLPAVQVCLDEIAASAGTP